MTPDDFRKMRAEYEANLMSDGALAAKWSITLATLNRHVKQNGWVKRAPIPEEEAIIAADRLQAEDPIETQTLTAAHVVTIHRKDVARLRTISNVLVERLGLLLSGRQATMLNEDGEKVPLVCLGSRESPADLLEKLSRVLVRTTEIERQAYGLKAFNPEEAANESELAKELDELQRIVEEVADNKARSDTASSIQNKATTPENS